VYTLFGSPLAPLTSAARQNLFHALVSDFVEKKTQKIIRKILCFFYVKIHKPDAE
jgi:hypothetical protein